MTWYQIVALVICGPVILWQLLNITQYLRKVVGAGVSPFGMICLSAALAGLLAAFLGFR